MKLVCDLDTFKKNVFLEEKEDIKEYINDIINSLDDLLDYLRDNEEEEEYLIEWKNRLYDTILLLDNSEIIEK